MLGFLFGKESERSKRSPFVQATINELESGEITSHNLDPCGISSMGVLVEGVRVHVSWFSSGRIHTITLNGKKFPYAGEAYCVLEAARNRADTLLLEEMSKLDSLIK